MFGRSGMQLSDDLGPVGWRGYGDGFAAFGALAGEHCRSPLPVAQGIKPFEQWFAYQGIGKIDASGVRAIGEQFARQGDGRVAIRIERRKVGNRIGRQLANRHFGIGHAIDETGIGTVFEQATHEIGQQILVLPDRGVYANRSAPVALQPAEFGVNVLSHAMKTLKLVIVAAVFSGQSLDRADSVGVMGREGGADAILRVKQSLGAGEIGYVGPQLAREYRVVGIAADLR